MLSYGEIREIERRERSNSALSEIPEDFYDTICKTLETAKNEAAKEPNITNVRKYDNLKRIVEIIRRKREEKIVFMAIHGVEPEHIIDVERTLYKQSLSAIEEFRTRVSGGNKVLKRLRIVKKVERYTGLDNKTYGPFEEGDDISISEAEASWLVKANMAEMI